MLKVKVPKEIRIGCFTYKVFLDESQEDCDLLGSALHGKLEIRIAPTTIGPRKDITLIHEVMHVVARAYAINPPEKDVELLGNGFSEFLLNNLGIEFDWSDTPSLEPKEVKNVK